MYSAENFRDDFDVSRETLDKFQAYHDLILKWQKRINLISPANIPDIWHRHFADSAFLNIWNPMMFWLISGQVALSRPCIIICATKRTLSFDTRKCAFLKTVARTGSELQIHNARAEDLDEFNADIVVSRATASILIFVNGDCHSHEKEFWSLKEKLHRKNAMRRLNCLILMLKCLPVRPIPAVLSFIYTMFHAKHRPLSFFKTLLYL